MTRPGRPYRLLFVLAIAAPLAAISSAHALGSASLRLAPELAVRVFPFNGLAAEKLAYARFADSVKAAFGEPSEQVATAPGLKARGPAALDRVQPGLQNFAAPLAQAARLALTQEPLLPKAHAILALSENNLQKKNQIIALASRLNRREISLQGLVLQQKADDADYVGTISTLDQILRVHPERRVEFFPLLASALVQKETRQQFTALLRNDLPWRDAFLQYAVGDPATHDNLADIRKEINPDNLVFDQRLIQGLAGHGKLDDAAAIYTLAAASHLQNGAAAWRSDYPPFDWKLADTPGLRAQPEKNSNRLEFTIEPGNGGKLATKIIAAPEPPFEIAIHHAIAEPLRATDLSLQVSCMGQPSPYFEERFANKTFLFRVEQKPLCAYFEITITGRAWTGSESLTGTLGPLQVKSE